MSQDSSFFIGQQVLWVPMWWKWDATRILIVTRTYPRGRARLSNGVIVDSAGFAQIYGRGREIGRIFAVSNAMELTK